MCPCCDGLHQWAPKGTDGVTVGAMKRVLAMPEYRLQQKRVTV
jgi:hypothetical protein